MQPAVQEHPDNCKTHNDSGKKLTKFIESIHTSQKTFKGVNVDKKRCVSRKWNRYHESGTARQQDMQMVSAK
jgi:hypothetical protein